MTTLTIEIPEKSEKTLADLIEQLGGKVVSKQKDSVSKLKASGKTGLSKKEEKFLADLDESIEFVNKHRLGEVKAKTIEELFNEL